MRFAGPVEVDETFIDGKGENTNAKNDKRRVTGRGGVDKAAVVGIEDRETSAAAAQPVTDTDEVTPVPCVAERTKADAVVFANGHKGHNALPRAREIVAHSAGEYLQGMTHTSGVRSLWTILERGYVGHLPHTFHQAPTDTSTGSRAVTISARSTPRTRR